VPLRVCLVCAPDDLNWFGFTPVSWVIPGSTIRARLVVATRQQIDADRQSPKTVMSGRTNPRPDPRPSWSTHRPGINRPAPVIF
jgi:hypothetical protein